MAPVPPVALRRTVATVGENAPPRIAPSAYVTDTPENRRFAGKSSAYMADCWP